MAVQQKTMLIFLQILATLAHFTLSQDVCMSQQMSSLQPDADIKLGAVLQLHKPGTGLFGCGAIYEPGVEHFEALRWGIEMLNEEQNGTGSSFIPGIKIGLDVYDSCGHADLAVRYMTELFPVMRSGSVDCSEFNSTVLGALDMSSSLRDPRVVETAGRFVIPIVPLRQDTSIPPEQLAKVLSEAVHDMEWERVAILHAEDEYSIFVTKVFSQIAKSGQPCISSIKSVKPGSDQKAYYKAITSFAAKLPDKTGVVVIGTSETFNMLLQTLSESQGTFSKLQWLFSWVPNFQHLARVAIDKRLYSLSPHPGNFSEFEDYWRRLADSVVARKEPSDRFYMEYVMARKNCKIAGLPLPKDDFNMVVCENLMLNDDQADVLLRTARFVPTLHALYTFANAYRKAWSEKCRDVPGLCYHLMAMSRREFVEQYLEPLEFSHGEESRSPREMRAHKTKLGTSGEVEGTVLALNSYSYNQEVGLTFKQVLQYDSQEAKVLDSSFRYIPSSCPKGFCKDCISVRQSRVDDPYIGMASSEAFVAVNETFDEISIPILLPLHKKSSNPLQCGEDIDPKAVQDLEAALWTLDQVNRDTEFLPDIRLKAVVIDTCSTPVQITQKLSNYLLDAKKTDLDDFSSDLAFVVSGDEETVSSATSVIFPMNVTIVSIGDSVRPKDAGKNHQLQVAAPFEKKTKAIVDVLRYLGWSFVTVLKDGTSQSSMELDSFKTFSEEGDICLSSELEIPHPENIMQVDRVVSSVIESKQTGARALVLFANEEITHAFLKGIHRAVLAKKLKKGDLIVISGSEWIVNLQSFKEFENEVTGVIVLKTQQGEVDDFATHYKRLHHDSNPRNPWFEELHRQKSGEALEYSPSTSTVNMIQGILAISAGLARLRNELCHPEPGLCFKMLQTPDLREHLYSYIRETASSRLDAKGEMFSFTKQGYGNLPIEIFNFRRAAGRNFVYQKIGMYTTHLDRLAEIVVTNSNDEEISVEEMRSECFKECDTCRKRSTDFVILDSKDHLYLATSIDIHGPSSSPLSCDATVTHAGLQTFEAFMWALDQINSSPRILPGVNLGAIIFDTCSSKEKAARDVANFFSSSITHSQKIPSVDQILGLVSTQDDNVITPIVDVAMPFDVLTIAPRVTSTVFNNAAKYPTLLRSSLPNDVRAAALVDLLKHFKWDYVSVVYSEESDLYRWFRKMALEKQITLALEEKISDADSDMAMNLLLKKLHDRQKENAKVVILFLEERDSIHLFESVSDEIDAGRLEIGEFVWLAFDSMDAFHRYPLVSMGALMIQPAYASVFGFKQYIGSLTPRNNSRNPWFRDYWEQTFKCRSSSCDGKHHSLSEMAFMTDQSSSSVINSVFSLGMGLEALRRRTCGGSDHGICAEMLKVPELRDEIFNFTAESVFMGADGKLFKFTDQRYAAGTLDVLNFRQVGSNAHAFINVGTYSPDEGLLLNFSRIKSYNENGKEISLYDIKSSCLDCKQERIDTSAMQIPSKQDFSILVSMPVHSKGNTFFTCGSFKDEKMFHHLAGITYAIGMINKNGSVIPGLELGALIFDYCNRPQKGEDQLYSFFSNENSHIIDTNFQVKPKSILAAITYGTEVSKESAPIFQSINVFHVATPTDPMDAEKNSNLLYIAPSTMSQIQAIVSIIRKFSWSYVNLVYSNTDFGRAGYYQFSKEAKQVGICLANVVIVEPDGTATGSLLTNLQNGLNREASVVVSLVDDEEIAKNMVEAIKVSYVLSKYVWIGTESWGNNLVLENSLGDAFFDSISLKLESEDMPEFEQYYENLTPWNHFPIPDVWFEEFWQHHFQCKLANSVIEQKQYTSVCSGTEKLSSRNIPRNEHIFQAVRTIQWIAQGLHNYLNKKCPYGMAARGIDDCGSEARNELSMEIQFLLHGASSDCEECRSSSTIFGFSIVQHSTSRNGTHKSVEIGSWKDGILFVDDSMVAFTSEHVPSSICKEYCGTCHSQLGFTQGLIAEQSLYANFHTVWGITVSALSILGILMVIVCALYFIWSFPITIGTTVLGYMILFGLLLLYTINFAFVLSPTEGTCGVRRFGLSLAYCVIFAGMLVKVMNTWRLMGHNGSRMLSDGTRLSSPAGLLVVAVGLVIIQVVLSSAWLILVPPSTDYIQGFLRCTPAETFEAGLAVSLVYCALVGVVATFFAILTARCHDNCKESRFILTCCIATVIITVIGAILGSKFNIKYREAAICFTNLLNASIIMALLYLRKVYLYGKLTRLAADSDMKTRLQPHHSVYGSSHKTLSTLAPAFYGSQASLGGKKLFAGPRVELINCPEDNKSESSGSAQVQATDLYPLEMYDGGSQFQPVASLYGSNHTLVLDDTLPFGR